MKDNYKWLITKEQKWLDKWDAIQMNSDQGMFTQTSIWLQSYQSYGFDYELLLAIDEQENIIGGFGNLIVKVSFLKLYVCTWGPVFTEKYLSNEWFDIFLAKFNERAKAIKAFVQQINFPLNFQTLNPAKKLIEGGYKKGNVIDRIYSPTQFNLIDLRPAEEEDKTQPLEERLFKSFKKNCRRDINISLRASLNLEFANTEAEIKHAYDCFTNNAQRANYSIREWKDIKNLLVDSVSKKISYILIAKKEEEIIGAIWVAMGGKIMTYVMGGTERLEKNFQTGHFLQWSAIQLAIANQLDFYNISAGGSEGVIKFKEGFNPKQARNEGPVFYVINPIKYTIFTKFYSFLRKNKKLASKILKFLKK